MDSPTKELYQTADFSRDATVHGNTQFQCFGCMRPPTHKPDPLHPGVVLATLLPYTSSRKHEILDAKIDYLALYLTVPAMRGCSTVLRLFWNFCVTAYFFWYTCFAIHWSCKPCLKCRGLQHLQIYQKSCLFRVVQSYQDGLKLGDKAS